MIIKDEGLQQAISCRLAELIDAYGIDLTEAESWLGEIILHPPVGVCMHEHAHFLSLRKLEAK